MLNSLGVAAKPVLKTLSAAVKDRRVVPTVYYGRVSGYPSAEGRLVCGAVWVEDRPYGCPYVQTCI